MKFAQLRAGRAARAASRDLHERFPDLISRVFWYGAVGIHPRHLVVWVLLKGPPATLPAWFFPDDAAPGAAIDEDLRDRLRNAADIVRSAFADRRWPDAGNVRVGFDSDERVAASGGWTYFK